MNDQILITRPTDPPRKRIAVFFGGASPEYSVSLGSASAVIDQIDRKAYVPVPIGISREGNWYLYTGDTDRIRNDTWQEEACCTPAVLLPGPGGRLLLLAQEGPAAQSSPVCQDRIVHIDGALPILHGQNGEDGTIQGLLRLSGVPLAGCGVLSSALCMDKDLAHRLVQAAGVPVPRSFAVSPRTGMEEILSYAHALGYPLYVKPVHAGSSFGITRVQEGPQLSGALELAFQYDTDVIMEENIDGSEVGCAVLGYDSLTMGEVDEIRLSGGFFDFTEKYTLKTARIHVPARIGPEQADQIKRTAALIYRTLRCSGFARIDLFLTPDGRLLFNEVNTIPGFTEHSRFPGMMRAAGLSLRELIGTILREAGL